MSEEIKFYFGEDGIAREYDDTYDITIHCTSQEEQDNVLKKLNREECSDAISRTEALANAHSMGVMIDADADDGSYYIKNPKYKSFDVVEAEVIKALPPVTPAEKVGHWIKIDDCSNSGYYCSECHKRVVKEGWSDTVKKIKYCPNCGAKMQEVEE